MPERRTLLLAVVTVSLACKGADSPSGECLSYACDEDGAKRMMWDTVDEAYKPSESAKAAFESAFSTGVSRMAQEKGFTPDGFELARGNLRKFLESVPEGGEDPLGPEAEKLKGKTHGLCPLWPYC